MGILCEGNSSKLEAELNIDSVTGSDMSIGSSIGSDIGSATDSVIVSAISIGLSIGSATDSVIELTRGSATELTTGSDLDTGLSKGIEIGCCSIYIYIQKK
jgi:hypothetical protein